MISNISAEKMYNIHSRYMNMAYKALGDKTSVTVKEYAKKNHLSLDEASAYDLDDNKRISLSEKASELMVLQAINNNAYSEDDTKNTVAPSMAMLVVEHYFDLKNAEKAYIKQMSTNKALNLCA